MYVCTYVRWVLIKKYINVITIIFFPYCSYMGLPKSYEKSGVSKFVLATFAIKINVLDKWVRFIELVITSIHDDIHSI